MRVVAAIVAPPHLPVTEILHTAEQLSAALMDHCDVTVASMMNEAAQRDTGGGRLPPRISVRTRMPLPQNWSRSSAFHTLFCRSDIRELIRRGSIEVVHIQDVMPTLDAERIACAFRVEAGRRIADGTGKPVGEALPHSKGVILTSDRSSLSLEGATPRGAPLTHRRLPKGGRKPCTSVNSGAAALVRVATEPGPRRSEYTCHEKWEGWARPALLAAARPSAPPPASDAAHVR
jgi:hypothetical protein